MRTRQQMIDEIAARLQDRSNQTYRDNVAGFYRMSDEELTTYYAENACEGELHHTERSLGICDRCGLERKLPGREEMIDDLFTHMFDGMRSNDYQEFIIQLLTEGCDGYKDMTDEQIAELWKEE